MNLDKEFDLILAKYRLKEKSFETMLRHELEEVAGIINSEAGDDYALECSHWLYFWLVQENLLYKLPAEIVTPELLKRFDWREYVFAQSSMIVSEADAGRQVVKIDVTRFSLLSKLLNYHYYEIIDRYTAEPWHSKTERAEQLYKIIGLAFYVKDCITAKKFITCLTEEQLPLWEAYTAALSDISALLDRAKQHIAALPHEQAAILVLDAWRYDNFQRMPLTQKWADNSLSFRQYFSYAGWTSQAFYAMYRSDKCYDHVSRMHAKLDGSETLPKMLARNGYTLKAISRDDRSAGMLSNIEKSRRALSFFTKDMSPISLIMWDLMAELCLSKEKSFVIQHCLMETHEEEAGMQPPSAECFRALRRKHRRGEVDFSAILETRIVQREHMHDFLDKQLAFWLPYFDSITMVLTADHGQNVAGTNSLFRGRPYYNQYTDEAYHVPFVVHGRKISAGVSDKLVSQIDLAKTLEILLTTGDEGQIADKEYITMCELPAYTQRYQTVMEAFTREQRANTKLVGCYTVRTKADKYMKLADGSESYYILPFEHEREHDLIDTADAERVAELRMLAQDCNWEKFLEENPSFRKGLKFFTEGED